MTTIFTLPCQLEDDAMRLTVTAETVVHWDVYLQFELLNVTTGHSYFRFPAIVLGADLKAFADAIERLIAGTVEKARLANWWEDVELEVTLADEDQAAGVQLNGRISLDWLTHDASRESEGSAPGLDLRLNRLDSDESQLPQLVTDIRAFLETSGVSLHNPWGMT